MNNDPLIEELRKHQVPEIYLEDAASIVRELMEKERFGYTREEANRFVLDFIKRTYL